MATLTLTGQANRIRGFVLQIPQLEAGLTERQGVWDKLDIPHRRAWVTAAAGTKDAPIVNWQESPDPILWALATIHRMGEEWGIGDADN